MKKTIGAGASIERLPQRPGRCYHASFVNFFAFSEFS